MASDVVTNLGLQVRAGRGAGITKRVKGDFSNEFLTQVRCCVLRVLRVLRAACRCSPCLPLRL